MATTMTIADFLAAGGYDGEYVIADTAANFAALSEADIGTIGAAGVTVSFDVAEDAVTVSVPQVQAMVAAGIVFAAGDTITLEATATEVTDANGELLAFRQAGVDVVDVTTGTADLYARGGVLDAIFAGLSFADPIRISDDDDYLRTLTPEQVQALADAGVGTIASTDAAGILAVSYDWWTTALDAGLTLVGTIRIAEPGDVLATRDFAALYDAGIRSVLSIGDFPVTLDAFAAFNASGLMLHGSTRSIADTGANIAALTGADLDYLLSYGISAITVTDGSVSLSLDAFNQFISYNLVPTQGEVVIDATDAEFAGFAAGDLANFAYYGADAIGGADGTLAVSLEQAGWLRDAGLHFAADDTITLDVTQAEFAALSAEDIADLAADGVDVVAGDGGALATSLAQVQAMVEAGLAFAAGDTITLAGTAADLAAASGDFLAFAEAGVDVIDVTSGTLSVPIADVLAAIEAGLTFADPVIASGGSADFQALDPAAFQMLADAGVTALRSTDADDFFRVDFAVAEAIAVAGLDVSVNPFTVITATGSDVAGADLAALDDAGFNGFYITGPMQISATQAVFLLANFGLTKVTWSDAWTVEVDQASIDALTTLNSPLHAYGFNSLTADAGTVLELDLAGAKTLVGVQFSEGLSVEIQSSGPLTVDMDSGGQSILMHGGMTFADDYVATLTGTASSLQFVYYADDIARTGIDVVECTSGKAVLTLGWATTMLDAGVEFDGAFQLLLDANSAGYDAASASFEDYVAAGIDELAFSGGSMSLTVAQVQAAIDAGLPFADGDTITLADTGANIRALDVAAVAAIAAANVDAIDVAGDAVTLSLATYEAILSAGLAFVAEDAVTLAMTAAEFAALSGQDIADLAATGVVAFSSTGEDLTVSLAQVRAMVEAGVTFTSADAVTLEGTAADLAAASADFLAFRQAGVDTIDVTSGTLDIYARGGVLDAIDAGLSFADPITLYDDDDFLRTLSSEQLEALADAGVHTLRSTAEFFASYSWFKAALDAGLAFAAGGTIAVVGPSSELADADFPALFAAGITYIESYGALELSASQALSMVETYGLSVFTSGTRTVVASPDDLEQLDAADIALLFNVDGSGRFTHMRASDPADVFELDIDQAAALRPFTYPDGYLTVEIQSDDPLSVSLGDAGIQFVLASGMTFAADFVATLTADASTLAASIATYYDEIASSGIDVIECTDGTAALSLLQAETLVDGGVTLDGTFRLVISASEFDDAVAAYPDLAAAGIDAIAFDGGAASLTADEAQAAIDAGVVFAAGNTVTLADTGSNIGRLSGSTLEALAAANVDGIDASDDAVAFNRTQIEALRTTGLALTADDVVTLVLSQSNVYGPSLADFQAYAAMGVDFIGAEDGLVLSLARVETILDAGLVFADEATVQLWDAGDILGALSAAEIAALGAAGVDVLATTEALTMSAAQILAAVDAGMDFDVGGQFRLADDPDTLAALTADELAALAAAGVDRIHSTTDHIGMSVAQALLFADAGIPFLADDTVTVAGAAANIAALSAADIAALGAMNVDVLNAGGTTDTDLSVTVDLAQAAVDAGLVFADGDTVTLADTAANIERLSGSTIEALAAANVDIIDASDDAVSFNRTQIEALRTTGLALTASDTVTLELTQSNVYSPSLADLQAYAAMGVDCIGAEDGLVISLERVETILDAGLVFADEASIELRDAGDILAALSAAEIAALGAAGVDTLATTEALTMSAAQILAAVDAGMDFDVGGQFRLADDPDTLAALTADELAALAAAGVGKIHSTTDHIGMSVEQALLFADAGIPFLADDTVTVAGAAANIAALSAAEIAALGAVNVDVLNAGGTTDTDLSVTVDLAQAAVDAGLSFADGDTVTLMLSQETIYGPSASALAAFAAIGVDLIGTDGTVQVSLARVDTIVAAGLTFADAAAVRIRDAGDILGALSAAEITALGAAGVDTLATSEALTMSVAQVLAAVDAGMDFAVDGQFRLTDDAAAIAALTADELSALTAAGVGRIHASTDGIEVSVAQALLFADAGIPFLSDDLMTVSGTATNILALSAADIAALGAVNFDVLDAGGASDVDVAVSVGFAEAAVDAGLIFADGDTITLADTAANIEGLSVSTIEGLAAAGVDGLDVDGSGAVSFDLAQFEALRAAGIGLTAADDIALADTGAALRGLTTEEIATLATRGVDRIDATDNALSITLAQSNAYAAAGITLTAADAVTLVGSGALLSGRTTEEIATLGARGVDRIDAADNALTLSLAKSNAYAAAGITLAAADVVTLADTGAVLSGRTPAQIAILDARGVDRIDATDNALTLTLAQSNAYAAAGITLTPADAVTLVGSGAVLSGLSTAQIATFDARGVDRIDATDNALAISLAKSNAYAAAGIALNAADVVTLADTGAVLSGLSTAQFASLDARGVDVLDATDNAVTFTAAELDALLLTDLSLSAGDTITLADRAPAISALAPAEIESLVSLGLDRVDVAGDGITLDLARYEAFKGVRFAEGDTLTVVGGGKADAIVSRGADMILDGNGGKDRLVGGAGDDTFLFDTRLGADNFDTITSFNVKFDHVELDNSIFKALKAGVLSAKAFFVGQSAEDAADRIIYDKKTGALFYDRDGDGDAAAVKFAVVKKGLALDHDDFFIV